MNKLDSSRFTIKSSPEQLLRLIKSERPDSCSWTDKDLPGMLKHQLAAPLEFDLGIANPITARQNTHNTSISDAARSGIKTFGDLFFHVDPPVGLLRLAKDFFKSKTGSSVAVRKPEQRLAYLLYLLSIVVAKQRGHAVISQLSPEELRAGVNWALTQEWADADVKALFRLAVQEARTGTKRNNP